MLTLTDLITAVKTVAEEFSIKRVMLFGSYAEGRNTAESDVDLLIEFVMPAVSLFILADIKNRLEDILNVDVDIIHAPLPDDALIKPKNMIEIYSIPK